MQYLGDFQPGATIYIYFNTFDSNDPAASVTITNLANTDIHIHKDDDLTQRNNAAGVTVDIDVDAITGSHFVKIDTSDNTVAAFFKGGHDYFVRMEGTTIDAATVNAVIGHFSLDNRMTQGKLVSTDIATLASQVSFTLTTGSADNNAYNGCIAVISDLASNIQRCWGVVSDYVGATKTVTLAADPGIFTMAAGDNITIVAAAPLQPTVAGATLDVTATGGAGVDWANVENPATALDLSGTAIQLVDTATVNTDMRGTDSAALASIVTEARLSELDAATGGKMANQVGVIEADTTSLNDTKIPDTISLLAINAEVDTALNTAIPGAPTANSVNQRVAAIDDLTQASGGGDLAAVLGDTNELQGDWVNGGRLDLLLDAIPTTVMRGTDLAALASVATEARLAELGSTNLPQDIDAILADTNELQLDDVPGLIAALNDLATSDILTQVNSALDTAIAELGVAAPTATPTIRTGLMLMYMMTRNKLVVQTSGTDAIEVYNNAGTKIAAKALADNGSDYTESEMA